MIAPNTIQCHLDRRGPYWHFVTVMWQVYKWREKASGLAVVDDYGTLVIVFLS